MKSSSLQERNAQSQTESAAKKKRVHNILRSFEADKTTLESAKQQLEGLKKDAQTQRDATRQKFGKAEAGSSSAEYQPKPGDSVRLLSMKGAKALVNPIPRKSRSASLWKPCASRSLSILA